MRTLFLVSALLVSVSAIAKPPMPKLAKIVLKDGAPVTLSATDLATWLRDLLSIDNTAKAITATQAQLTRLQAAQTAAGTRKTTDLAAFQAKYGFPSGSLIDAATGQVSSP